MTGTPKAPEALVGKVSEWFALKGQIIALGDREKALRQEIFDEAFPGAAEKGTNRVELSHGKDLKGENKTNYTVDRAVLAEVRPNIPAEVFDRVVRWKPEVSASEFDRVTDPEQKRLFSEFITSRPGLPSLEIVDEKKRRS